MCMTRHAVQNDAVFLSGVTAICPAASRCFRGVPTFFCIRTKITPQKTGAKPYATRDCAGLEFHPVLPDGAGFLYPASVRPV